MLGPDLPPSPSKGAGPPPDMPEVASFSKDGKEELGRPVHPSPTSPAASCRLSGAAPTPRPGRRFTMPR